MVQEVKANAPQTKSVGARIDSGFSKMRTNPWMPAAIVLGVLLVAVLFMRSGSVSGNVVSTDAVGQKILGLAKAQVADATLKSVNLVNGHYDIVLSSSQGDIPISVSGDGNYILQPLPSAGQTTKTAATKKISDLDLSNEPTIGNKNAPVTVVEFSDFSCPFCQAASGDNAQVTASAKAQFGASWEPIVTNLMKDYVQTGKVKFVYVYAWGHSGGHPASLVGWCLNDQSSDLFWKYYTQVFASPTQSDVEDLTKMEALAKGVGADMTKLQSCLDSKKYDSRFDVEQAMADSVGSQGTPAFFVNDNYVAHGAESYTTVVKPAIDAALTKAG